MIYPYITAPPADFNEILPNTRAGITENNFLTPITSRDFCITMAGGLLRPLASHNNTLWPFYENFESFTSRYRFNLKTVTTFTWISSWMILETILTAKIRVFLLIFIVGLDNMKLMCDFRLFYDPISNALYDSLILLDS